MTETIVSTPIKITPSALIQLRKIKTDQNIDDSHGLRVGVKGGGCSGFSYVLGFDLQKEKDEVFELDGMKILMEKSHGIYLIGMEVDWHDGLNNRGFTFTNPNAQETCGCGTSFSA
jgi:iron-sulfur cluster assembly protein